MREGDELQLNMPAGITFAFNSSAIQPQFQGTLNQVAQTLAQYNQTYIDVLGHTDSVGSDAFNQTLSEQRAGSVANYLASQGVNRARIATRGYGETQPVASNDTEVGRAENRRVNIRVVPVTQQVIASNEAPSIEKRASSQARRPFSYPRHFGGSYRRSRKKSRSSSAAAASAMPP